jgi:hypothetical protein
MNATTSRQGRSCPLELLFKSNRLPSDDLTFDDGTDSAASAMEKDTLVPLADPQYRAHLGTGESIHVAKRYHLSLSLGQVGDGGVHLLSHGGRCDAVQHLVGPVSLLPFAVLMSTVRQRLAGIGCDVFLLGVASFMAATTIELWFDAGLSAHAATTSASTLSILAGIAASFTPTLTVADLLMAAPVAMAALRAGRFPRWYGYLSLAFAIEQAVETLTITERHGFAAAGGTMNYTLGAGLFLIWIAASGFVCTPAATLDPAVVAPHPRP